MRLAFPIITVIFLLFCVWGAVKKVDVLSAFVKGVKNGIETLKFIFPNLLFVLSVIFVVRSSGIMDAISSFISPLSSAVGIPPEVVPMALLRPLSGSGSMALLQDIFVSCGSDSYTAFLASVISASTETTFYTLSVYLGGIKEKLGKVLFAALLLDFLTLITATVVTPFFF